MHTDIMFATTEINGMTLANRFVRSATWEGMAGDDGSVTSQLIDLMAQLARGGEGLTTQDAVTVAGMLVQGGIDAIEVSGGLFINPKMSPSRMGINAKAKCLSDNKCFGPAMAGRGICCVMKRGADADR